MPTYRLIPKAEWEGAISALESAVAALRRCGSMTLPDMGSEAPAARANPRISAVSGTTGAPRRRARGVDGAALVQEVVDRVHAGGPRHVPKKFDRSGPTIADFVDVLANDEAFRVPVLIDLLSQYVELKDTRREAAGQIRTAVS